MSSPKIFSNPTFLFLAERRRSVCGNCTCNVVFENPTSSCPMGKWKSIKVQIVRSEADLNPEEESKISNIDHEKQYPAIGAMAKNFTRALGQEAKAIFSGMQPVSEEEKAKRLEICRGCEFFDPSQERCKKCGCFMKAKVSWRSQSCPIGKW